MSKDFQSSSCRSMKDAVKKASNRLRNQLVGCMTLTSTSFSGLMAAGLVAERDYSPELQLFARLVPDPLAQDKHCCQVPDQQ
jgi:hypothetical protein